MRFDSDKEKHWRKAMNRSTWRLFIVALMSVGLVAGVSSCSQEPAGQHYTNGIGMAFVLIPAGTFQMGCEYKDDEKARLDGRIFKPFYHSKCKNDEKPVHEVRLSRPFYLGKYEVTQAQWEAVMGTNPSRFKGQNHPVENVSWDDVQVFISKLNAKERLRQYRYRLPTEAEWEYAARAGSTTLYCFGNSGNLLWGYARFYSLSSGPVGQRQANAWGLHDMHGNVREWVQDRMGAYSAYPVVDPQGSDEGKSRVLRGGGWGDHARNCRSASRDAFWPNVRDPLHGFRLALSRTGEQ